MPGGPGREPRPGPHGLNLGVGDHICGFYRKPSERDDILIPFLVEGLRAGDKCTCVVDSCTPDDVLASMSEQIEVDAFVSVSQLEVLDAAAPTWPAAASCPSACSASGQPRPVRAPGAPASPGTSAT